MDEANTRDEGAITGTPINVQIEATLLDDILFHRKKDKSFKYLAHDLHLRKGCHFSTF